MHCLNTLNNPQIAQLTVQCYISLHCDKVEREEKRMVQYMAPSLTECEATLLVYLPYIISLCISTRRVLFIYSLRIISAYLRR